MKSRAAPLIIGLLLASLTIMAAYTGGYLLLGETKVMTTHGLYTRSTRLRVYRAEWIGRAFAPAAKLESLLTGETVVVGVSPTNDLAHSFYAIEE